MASEPFVGHVGSQWWGVAGVVLCAQNGGNWWNLMDIFGFIVSVCPENKRDH